MRHIFLIALPLALSTAAAAQQLQMPNPNMREADQINYPAFAALTQEVAGYRSNRLIDLSAFNQKRGQKNVVILDARSATAFARGHIDGAINIPFSDFTDEKLEAILGKDKSREILIYCNNNFFNDIPPIVLKSASLALNIPTFINLYGYGYKNIYELSGSYNMKDPKVGWVSTPDTTL